MPHGNDIEFMRQLYRAGHVSIRDNGVVVPVVDRTTNRMRRYRPWQWGTPDEQERRGRDYLEAALRVRAEEAIRAVWNGDGGPRSPVGLPKTEELTVTRSGDDWQAAFRSGSITVKSHENKCHILTKQVLKVDFVGLECNVRQEGTDELYGVVALIGPANRVLGTHVFPGGDETLTMGPDGQRIWTTNNRLYEGPIEDVSLVATLVEHDDFADVEGAARKIADTIAEKGGQLLGALTGIPAESVTDETWFRDGLAEALGFVMGDIFGMGDDPYAGQYLPVPWDEIGEWGPRRQPARTRNDDPKQIPRWTHRVKVTGRDDGGDYGDYDFYFDVSVEQVDVKRECPIPPQP